MKKILLAGTVAVLCAFGGFASPDLVPDGLDGWSAPLVASDRTDDFSGMTAFDTTDDVYVSWAVKAMSEKVSTAFRTALFVDGTRVKTWKTSSLSANDHAFVRNYSLGKLTQGTHTLRIVTDSDSEVKESSESNNGYSVTVPSARCRSRRTRPIGDASCSTIRSWDTPNSSRASSTSPASANCRATSC